MKKYLGILLLIVITTPSVAFASWWNPFTWFNFNNKTESKKEVKVDVKNDLLKESVKQAVKTPEVKIKPIVQKSPLNNKEKINTTTGVINDVKKVTEYVTDTPTIKPLPVQNSTISIAPSLIISDINFSSTFNSVKINWRTNLDSESKFIFNGNTFYSKNGIGTNHSVEINNLEQNKQYSGDITAITNGTWKSEKLTFYTKQEPLKITNVSQSCLGTSCTISWQTNYPTNSNITITKVGGENVSWFFDSENGVGLNHKKTINNALPNKEYYFKINANYSNETVEKEESFMFNVQIPDPHTGSGSNLFHATSA